MKQKIMTKFKIMVIEYDKTGYYYPKYKTEQTIIAETSQEAKEEALKRTDWQHNFGGGWVKSAKIISSEDIVIDTTDIQ